jgi:outer membrane protein OmpA-like peptidoglycan-associated protein
MWRRPALPLLAAVTLVACGGGGGRDDGRAAEPDPDSTNGSAVTAGTDGAGGDESGSDLSRDGGDSASDLDSQISESLSDLDAEQRGDDTVLTVPEQVLFDFGHAELRPDAGQVLDDLAQVIDSVPDAPVQVNGHTDSIGSDAANQRLSEQRARAVADHLTGAGVDAARVQAHGFGETRPVAPNADSDGSDNPEGRAANRRVEIVLEGADLTQIDPSPAERPGAVQTPAGRG